jgi:hypothetical protein
MRDSVPSMISSAEVDPDVHLVINGLASFAATVPEIAAYRTIIVSPR